MMKIEKKLQQALKKILNLIRQDKKEFAQTEANKYTIEELEIMYEITRNTVCEDDADSYFVFVIFCKCQKEMKRTSCVKILNSHNRWYEETTELHYDLRTPLIPFLPKNALDEVVTMLKKHTIYLLIVPPRKKRLGDCERKDDYCRITINNNLDNNKFLQVFLHEYAHLLTRLNFTTTAQHGSEFYFCLSELHAELIKKKIIPENYFGGFDKMHKHRVSDFPLKTIKIGSQFKHQGEIFTREKGLRGKISCTKLSDNTKMLFESEIAVVPVI